MVMRTVERERGREGEGLSTLCMYVGVGRGVR